MRKRAFGICLVEDADHLGEDEAAADAGIAGDGDDEANILVVDHGGLFRPSVS